MPIAEFLCLGADIPVLDVRSPGEYSAGHLPGAYSFPLFTNRERARVGTLYKQQGKKEAVKLGLDIVGPKMRGFVEEAEKLGSDTVALYCWRGGMRSESVAWLLERYGFKTLVLDGGYKALRRQINRFFTEPLPICVLTGYTGSQKTLFLGMLEAEGAQVVDLEGIAGHQGSIFGNHKCEGQPTTEHFHNLLYEAFRALDRTQPIWIEDESFSIGRVNLPEGLFQQKKQAPHVFIEVRKEDRVEFLVKDYGGLEKSSLIEATRSISERLGSRLAKEAIDFIGQDRLAEAAEIILTYYDSRYYKSIEKKRERIIAHYAIGQEELPSLAARLAKMNITRHD